MDSTAVRFIHASDFGLDLPVEGTGTLSSAIESRLLTASRRAVERLVDTILLEAVDFVLLTGDLCQLTQTGPGTAVFLVEQFERCAARDIPIYWAGGPDDSPEDWHAVFSLPPNVHRFPSDTVQEFFWGRGDVPLIRLIGMSRNTRDAAIRTSGFTHDAAGLFTIAVANGTIDPDAVGGNGIPFWAMGHSPVRNLYRCTARRTHKVPHTSPSPYIVHYAGPPLARTPRSGAEYGATLVELEPTSTMPGEPPFSTEAVPKLTLLPTSPLRWLQERVALTPDIGTTALFRELHGRMTRFAESSQAKDVDTFVSFRVSGAGERLLWALRHESAATDILAQLATAFGDLSPMVAAVAIDLDLPEMLETSLYEQQTILGDYLRLIRHHQLHPDQPLDLSPLFPPEWMKQPLVSRLLLAKPGVGSDKDTDTSSDENDDGGGSDLDDTNERVTTGRVQTQVQRRRQVQLLREAALLGSELLGQARQGKAAT